jgi:large subunit ribosomal protein L24
MKIKKGDNVTIISGDDKGKSGKVIKVVPQKNQIVVEGINIVKKHERPRKQGQKGQVVDVAMPFNASKARSSEKVKSKK